MTILLRSCLYIITSPFCIAALIVDAINIFTKTENEYDKSYFLSYLDEIEKWARR